jgi:hypothetical protein
MFLRQPPIGGRVPNAANMPAFNAGHATRDAAAPVIRHGIFSLPRPRVWYMLGLAPGRLSLPWRTAGCPKRQANRMQRVSARIEMKKPGQRRERKMTKRSQFRPWRCRNRRLG